MKSFFYTLLILILSTFFFSCNPDKEKRVSATEPRNSTTQSSVLFFKNMRTVPYFFCRVWLASDLYDWLRRAIGSYDEIQDNTTENHFIKCYFLLKKLSYKGFVS